MYLFVKMKILSFEKQAFEWDVLNKRNDYVIDLRKGKNLRNEIKDVLSRMISNII